MRFLLFRLYGPMAAWGDVAVGERRPSLHQPTKSAVLGLIAGALGLGREDEPSLAALQAGYGYACRVDVPPIALTDFHTVQPVPETAFKKRRIVTRRDALSVPDDLNSPILSRRDYVLDTAAVAAIWSLDTAPATLEAIAGALRKPCFVPYLGRKSCPPGLPFDPHLIEAQNPVEALDNAELKDSAFLEELDATSRRYHWEGDFAGLQPLETVRRRDQAGNRSHWQFYERTEHIAREE